MIIWLHGRRVETYGPARPNTYVPRAEREKSRMQFPANVSREDLAKAVLAVEEQYKKGK